MATLIESTLEVLSGGYILRPATWDDLVAVTELINTCSWHDLGVLDLEVDDLRREWETPGWDLTSATRVVVSPRGQVVAYYEVWDGSNPPVRIQIWGRIHPQHTGRGLGTRLLAWGVERARQALPRTPEGARVSVGVPVWSSLTDARRLFEANGFHLVRHYLRMVIDLPEAPSQPTWPADISVRSLRRGQDERRVLQAQRESFRDHWGFVETDFEEYYQRYIKHLDGDPDFDPDLFFIAEQDGQIAGISLCWLKLNGEPDLGWVGTLGVLRPWRRQGLGLALLQHSFVELYRRGQRKVGLGVDATSLTGATRLYEKAGMRSDPKYQMSFYELELRSGVDLSTQKVDGA